MLVIAFLWIPLIIIALYAFNGSTIQGWPITSWTTHWFSVAWHDPDVRNAFELSVKVGAITTVIALVLGTMAAAAVARYRFFGREAVSFLLVLPLALPGIITGDGAGLVLQLRRDPGLDLDDRDRPRDLLRRRRLQQRRRATAPLVGAR